MSQHFLLRSGRAISNYHIERCSDSVLSEKEDGALRDTAVPFPLCEGRVLVACLLFEMNGLIPSNSQSFHFLNCQIEIVWVFSLPLMFTFSKMAFIG